MVNLQISNIQARFSHLDWNSLDAMQRALKLAGVIEKSHSWCAVELQETHIVS